MYRTAIKPFFDRCCAVLGLLVLSPVLLLTALLLWWVQGGSPFFLQVRPGKGERLFKIIKFRTMTNARDAQGKLLPDAQRITAVGRFVRKSSLDELPQLINVLKGEMSFVGPRPLLPEYLPLYNDYQRQRHQVLPGITGWAQVNGRNAVSWDEKFALDVWYVKHQSFALDSKILLLTVKKVFLRSDINTEGAATTHRFSGNKNG